jgi:hypothetical protein
MVFESLQNATVTNGALVPLGGCDFIADGRRRLQARRLRYKSRIS